MQTFLQALISGGSQGCVYALLALGFSVIYSTLKMGHFAHGDLYMAGVFVALTLWTQLQLPVIFVFIGTAAIISLGMLVLERIAYRPLYSESSGMSLIMVTMGMQFVIQTIVRLIWGNEIKRFPPLFDISARFEFTFIKYHLTISMQNLMVISISVGLMLTLLIFMTQTKTGLAMSAVSMNRKAASLMGVKITTIITATYIIGAALAAVTGTLMGPQYNARYAMGGMMGTKAQIAAIMGGFGSMPGAVVGGMILGFVETLSALYISTAYKDVVSFGILILILFIKPGGIFGQPPITKV